jgi:hypothetical protein
MFTSLVDPTATASLSVGVRENVVTDAPLFLVVIGAAKECETSSSVAAVLVVSAAVDSGGRLTDCENAEFPSAGERDWWDGAAADPEWVVVVALKSIL